MKAKALLAEDDADLAFVIKDNLEEEGCQVGLCKDGDAALQQFSRAEVDICLLDVMMPVKDGFTVARKIRQKNAWIPILFLTARSQEQDKLEGFRSGADDYITKPFSMKELLMRMEVFLRRTRKTQANGQKEFQLGTLSFVAASLKLSQGSAIISLTQREADLLLFFCEHANQVLRPVSDILALRRAPGAVSSSGIPIKEADDDYARWLETCDTELLPGDRQNALEVRQALRSPEGLVTETCRRVEVGEALQRLASAGLSRPSAAAG